PAVRAARVLPGRAGRRALRGGRGEGAHGRRLDLRARLGLALRGPALARARTRGRGAAPAPAAAGAPDAATPLPARAPERLAAPRRGLGGAPARGEGRVAPALRPRRRRARPPQPRDRLADGALGRCRDRDRPGRGSAIPRPAP